MSAGAMNATNTDSVDPMNPSATSMFGVTMASRNCTAMMERVRTTCAGRLSRHAHSSGSRSETSESRIGIRFAFSSLPSVPAFAPAPEPASSPAPPKLASSSAPPSVSRCSRSSSDVASSTDDAWEDTAVDPVTALTSALDPSAKSSQISTMTSRITQNNTGYVSANDTTYPPFTTAWSSAVLRRKSTNTSAWVPSPNSANATVPTPT
mmetsp:Transcript_9691/g.27045  ORF Transcript_9691/g.27045 Transcript_9691/m.27045 type:complete len:208 (-) Transcript_9691:1411-2034(-)